jgi:hypothetical protein
MSAASDRFEKLIAESANNISGITATRPTVGTQYSDVLLKKGNSKTWLEVKMNHTDNLSNPRVYYKDSKWHTTYTTPAAAEAVDILNKDPKTKKFIKDLIAYTGIPAKLIKIPTTKGGLKDPGAVPLHIMKKFFDRSGVNRYISEENDYDMGKLVTKHYTVGKAEPAYYMQAADDFYRISNANPFGVPVTVPMLSGKGVFKVRVATRSQFYEVQAELKITSMGSSPFSLSPNTRKKNPFSK